MDSYLPVIIKIRQGIENSYGHAKQKLKSYKDTTGTEMVQYRQGSR